MTLKQNSFGWHYLVCDYCGASFGSDDTRVRKSKEETFAAARRIGWQIGKRRVYCNAHKKKENRPQERIVFHVGEEGKANCDVCRYASSGGQTMVCQYYGSEETSPYGDCIVFEEEERE